MSLKNHYLEKGGGGDRHTYISNISYLILTWGEGRTPKYLTFTILFSHRGGGVRTQQ